jgi:hypothetical protein
MTADSQPAQRIEDIDFGKSMASGFGTLFLVIVGYLPGPVIMATFFWKDLKKRPQMLMDSWPYLAGLASVYLLGLFLLLFYGVFAVYRHRFSEEGLHIRSLLGWKVMRWKDIQFATISTFRGVYLVLVIGRFKSMRLSLGDYRKQMLLLEEVGKRLNVPITAPPELLTSIVDR